MKKILLILLTAAMLVACHESNNVAEAIIRQVAHYPQSSLQDVYKSFYQDRFGPGHMISDTAAFNEYNQYELAVAAADAVPNPYYEPVGAEGRFIRVYLRCVNEGLISAEQLFDAFLRSAVPAEQPPRSWADEWSCIERTARELGLTASNADYEALRHAAKAEQAIHHSEAYRNAYHPHYRIIKKTIFESEIEPHLPYSSVGEEQTATTEQ